MIDTLTYAKKLEDVGFTKEQAETLIMLSSELSFHHLATKEEIHRLSSELRGEMQQLSTELRGEMQKLRLEVRNEMQAMENRLTIRLGIMMGTMFTVFFAAITLVINLKG